MLLSMVFAFSFYNLVCAKPPFLEASCSHSFNQLSQGGESQPQGEAFEPEESISQGSNITSNLKGSLKISTSRKRIASRSHICVSGMTKEYDFCRQSLVTKAKCRKHSSACMHVIPQFHRPMCITIQGYRNDRFVNKCPPLPNAIDCGCPPRRRIENSIYENPCISKICELYDNCRKSLVRKVERERESAACLQSVNKYSMPKCIPVYQEEDECPALQINCQCAWTNINQSECH